MFPDVESRHVSLSSGIFNLQFHEADLPIRVVQDLAKRAIDEIDLRLIQSKRDRESQLRRGPAFD